MAPIARVAGALIAILFLLVIQPNDAEETNFRTCKDTSFCRRNRNSKTFKSQNYKIKPDSVNINKENNLITAKLANNRHKLQEPLNVEVSILHSNTGPIFRVRITEEKPLYARYEVKDVLQTLKPSNTAKCQRSAKGVECFDGIHSVTVVFSPFHVKLSTNKKPVLFCNGQAKMMFEQYRKDKIVRPKDKKDLKKPSEMPFPYDVSGMWEEKFKDFTDTKLR